MQAAVAVLLLLVGVVDALHINDPSPSGSEHTDTLSLFSDVSQERYLRSIKRGKAGNDVLERVHNKQLHGFSQPDIPHGHAQRDMEPDKQKHNGTNWCAGRETRQFCNVNFNVSLTKAELVVSTFWEDLGWLSDYDGPTHVYVHNRTESRSHCYGCNKNEDMEIAIKSQQKLEYTNEHRKYSIKFFSIPNIGDEASGYLTYILTHYEDLPDMIMFIHGHECSRHNSFDMLMAVRKVRRCFSMQQGYMDLNDMVDTPTCYENFQPSFVRGKFEFGAKLRLGHLKKVWPSLFEEEFGKLPNRWCMDPYAQFVVTKERVQAHSKNYYHKLFNAVVDGTTTMEYFWRMLFVPGFV